MVEVGGQVLSDPTELVARYQASQAMREYAANNHGFWRQTHGGRGMAEAARFDFDPIEHYWRRTERRLLVSFFVDRLREAYAPAVGLRTLAFRLFRHFDEARNAGRLGELKVIKSEGTGHGDWPGFLELTRPVARELPDFPEYARLRDIWGRQLKSASMRDELLLYFEEAAKEPRLGELEKALNLRLAWFPYLELTSLEHLATRQRFFSGYYQALTSTNSYSTGGSLSFAPVVQNNRALVLLDYLKRWTGMETPHDTKFVVAGKTETKDRAEYAPVVELYCVLNLHRVPILNSRSEEVFEKAGAPGDLSVYDRILRAGGAARTLMANSPLAPELSRLFLKLLEEPSTPWLMMEGIRRPPIAAKYPDDVAAQIDPSLNAALDEHARMTAAALSEVDRAVAMYHLLVDASIYEDQQKAKPAKPAPDVSQAYSVQAAIVATGTTAHEPKEGPKVQLPVPLERIANDALGYLRAGSHVLLAGPPGTGKTTVAQFVGHAWKRNDATVPLEILVADAPVTTVATSAWSPFHTTGGLFPTADNRVEPMPGVFIDPKVDKKGEWRLRGDCIVLDEMNRADLDRCIGELYPLLSGSVARVRPAGLPGIDSIVANERFRIVATVNDASLDDVVFPISEGLARRFVRLELFGATLEALKGLLAKGKPDSARQAAALSVIEQLFDVCKDQKLLARTDDGDHLPFGVGYFGIAHRWVTGDLRLSKQFQEEDLDDQATGIIRTSLASVVRVRGLSTILASLGAEAE